MTEDSIKEMFVKINKDDKDAIKKLNKFYE